MAEPWDSGYQTLIDEVLERSTGRHSVDHGEHHWQLVGAMGAELAPLVPGADLHVGGLLDVGHPHPRPSSPALQSTLRASRATAAATRDPNMTGSL